MTTDHDPSVKPSVKRFRPQQNAVPAQPPAPREIGGRRDGTEPVRYGEWEKQGRCIDF